MISTRPILTTPLAIDLNDAAVAVVSETGLLHVEPAYVVVAEGPARFGADALGRIDAARVETVEGEADVVARWIAAARAGGAASAAILCRKRSQFPPIVAALTAHGIPFEVVGLGGLLQTPEVADLVAMLTVAHDASRGDRLMRLLTGPVARLGAADIDAFGGGEFEIRGSVGVDIVAVDAREGEQPSGSADAAKVPISPTSRRSRPASSRHSWPSAKRRRSNAPRPTSVTERRGGCSTSPEWWRQCAAASVTASRTWSVTSNESSAST